MRPGRSGTRDAQAEKAPRVGDAGTAAANSGVLGTNANLNLAEGGNGSLDNAALIDGAFSVGKTITLQNGTTTTSTWTLGGNQAAISSFTGNVITGTSTNNRTLNLTQVANGTVTFSGVIGANPGTGTTSVAVIGGGTVILSNTNTYDGTTTVSAGTLEVSGKLSSTTAVNVTSGTLLLSGNNAVNSIGNAISIGATGVLQQSGSGKTDLLGSLTLSAGSTIDFGAGNSNTFTFGNLATFAGLKVTGWTGSLYAPEQTDAGGVTQDRLLFNTSTGLNDTQLASINFYGDDGITQIGSGAMQISYNTTQFEIVPVPEPSTWFAAIGLLGMVGYRERRRIARMAGGYVGA